MDVMGPGTPAATRLENAARLLDLVSGAMIRAAEEARDVLSAKPEENEGKVRSCPAADAGRDLAAADAGLGAVLAEKDHVEGRAEEHPHGAQGVADAVRVTALGRGGAARAGRRTGGVDGGCAHAFMVAP
ncbi:hypothetical protein GCM10010265_60400 [Streptomyces griseoincarnatus]|nr:hypothetical protein GCM10010265_60400 [Streptomyces griseoincarnatus]